MGYGESDKPYLPQVPFSHCFITTEKLFIIAIARTLIHNEVKTGLDYNVRHRLIKNKQQ